MEGICGVFQSTLLAPWVTAGTGLVAIGLYLLNRRNQLADMAKRRKVVHTALKERIEKAISRARSAREGFKKFPARRDESGFLMRADLGMLTQLADAMRVPNLPRLQALQLELFKVGDAGDECIARFIEQCMDVEQAAISLKEAALGATHDEDSYMSLPYADLYYLSAPHMLDELIQLEPNTRAVLGTDD